jgi:hypothetical protein
MMRRGELLAAGLFCAVSVAGPLWRVELYPFTRAPMFADAPRRYCDYAVFDLDGKALPAVDFGLQRNYWGNPVGVGVGFRPPEGIDDFGAVPEPGVVVRTVERHLARFPHLEAVQVMREVIGPVDERRVGVVSRERWRVANPHHRPERSP